jgi:hypothetical protein
MNSWWLKAPPPQPLGVLVNTGVANPHLGMVGRHQGHLRRWFSQSMFNIPSMQTLLIEATQSRHDKTVMIRFNDEVGL